jgi:hypothetical protein
VRSVKNAKKTTKLMPVIPPSIEEIEREGEE